MIKRIIFLFFLFSHHEVSAAEALVGRECDRR